MQFKAKFMIFTVLKFTKVMYVNYTGEVGN